MEKKNINEEKISRKQAIKKVGVTALTATTLMFLQTKANAATSTDTAGGAAKPRTGRPTR